MRFIVNNLDYDINKTIHSGQAFRFTESGDGTYTVFSGNHFCNIKRDGSDIIVWDDDIVDDGREEMYWNYYFGFDDDMWEVERTMLQSSFLADIYEECKGLYLLRQEPWETLVCFIISQQKRIEQIKACVDKVCKAAGSYNSRLDYYSFPTPEQLLYTDISTCGLGYREEYIKAVANRMVNGTLDLSKLCACRCTYEEAKAKLLEIYGVGEKVADCMCLFGLGYRRAFPIDVHIKRMLELPEMKDFSIKSCGDSAGYVQQYLFKYAIDHNI